MAEAGCRLFRFAREGDSLARAGVGARPAARDASSGVCDDGAPLERIPDEDAALADDHASPVTQTAAPIDCRVAQVLRRRIRGRRHGKFPRSAVSRSVRDLSNRV
jgi:hypothetical protein